MKNLKKVLALVLAVVMVMGAVVTTSAAYTDVKDTDTYANAIDVLSNLGILDGFTDGTFKPEGTLTRAQTAKIVAIVANAKTVGYIDTDIDELYANAINPFVDCNNSWALPYINYCRITKLCDGMSATTYEPNREVTGNQFLKFMLTTLGFDTSKEGYTGTGWDINVLNRANEIGLTDGLAKGWQAGKPITRGEAAQIIVNALSSYLVEYGQKVKNTVNDNIYTAAFISNEAVAQSGYQLGGKMGITCERAYDVFMRPGYKWGYEYSTWTAFYADAPVLSYTGKVTACDILVDLGVAKTSNSGKSITYFRDGRIDTDGWKTVSHTGASEHIACSTPVANTGALTQVFKVTKANGNTGYFVCIIDTVLAKVTGVTKSTHGSTNVATATLELYTPAVFAESNSKFSNNKYTVSVPYLTDYAKGDYILTYVAADYSEKTPVDVNNWVNTELYGDWALYADDTKAYNNETIGVYEASKAISGDNYTLPGDLVVAPFAMAGTINSAVYSGQNDDVSVITVNGTKTPVNCTYTKTGIFENYSKYMVSQKYTTNFFTDQYGNVIGDSNVFASNYGIVDAAKWVNNGDLTVAEYAQFALVDLDAKTNYVTVSKYNDKALTGVKQAIFEDDMIMGATGNNTVAQNAANNGAYTASYNAYGLVKYTVSDGVYSLTNNVGTLVDWGDATNKAIGAGQVKIGNIYANGDTKFIVRTTDAAGNHVYTAYAGVNALPTMSKVTAAVHVTEAGATYASLVYVIADSAIYAGSSVTAYVTDKTPSYLEVGEVTEYTVYVDGEATKITYTGEGDLFDSTGLYTLNFLTGDAKVASATKVTTGWTGLEAAAEIATGAGTDGAIKLSDSTGLNVSSAKIYVVSGGAVAAGTTADLADGAKVMYKLASGSTYMVETIYVVG